MPFGRSLFVRFQQPSALRSGTRQVLFSILYFTVFVRDRNFFKPLAQCPGDEILETGIAVVNDGEWWWLLVVKGT